MSQFQHFTSLPPEQEATFIVYEQRNAEAQKSGTMFGVIFGLIAGLLIIGARLIAEPDHSNPIEEPGNKTVKKAEPAPTPAEAPK